MAILARGAWLRRLLRLGTLLILSFGHRQVHLLILLALALALVGLAFLVVLFVEFFAVRGVEVRLRLVGARGEGRRVGVLDLVHGALVGVVGLRRRAV